MLIICLAQPNCAIFLQLTDIIFLKNILGLFCDYYMNSNVSGILFILIEFLFVVRFTIRICSTFGRIGRNTVHSAEKFILQLEREQYRMHSMEIP